MNKNQYIELLQNDVTGFNTWHKALQQHKRNGRLDLTKANLTEADLTGAYLDRANLNGAKFNQTATVLAAIAAHRVCCNT